MRTSILTELQQALLRHLIRRAQMPGPELIEQFIAERGLSLEQFDDLVVQLVQLGVIQTNPQSAGSTTPEVTLTNKGRTWVANNPH